MVDVTVCKAALLSSFNVFIKFALTEYGYVLVLELAAIFILLKQMKNFGGMPKYAAVVSATIVTLWLGLLTSVLINDAWQNPHTQKCMSSWGVANANAENSQMLGVAQRLSARAFFPWLSRVD